MAIAEAAIRSQIKNWTAEAAVMTAREVCVRDYYTVEAGDEKGKPEGDDVTTLQGTTYPSTACGSVRTSLRMTRSHFLAKYQALPTGSRTGAVAGAADSPSGAAASGAAISQSQPSLMQVRNTPCLVFFSTMNAAPHFGHGSFNGSYGVVKSQS